MTGVMQAVYPGFEWRVAGFFIGLAWNVIATFYIPFLFVPSHNSLQHGKTL